MTARKTTPARKTPAAQTTPPADADQPTPISTETDENVMDLNDLLDADQETEETPAPAKKSATHKIKILVPNFVAFGRVWGQGTVLEISEDTYEKQVNREGFNWVDKAGDKKYQDSVFGLQTYEVTSDDAHDTV